MRRMQPPRPDITRTTLAVLVIGGLLAGSFWVLRPFLGALLWATLLVVATWPALLGLQARLWNRRGLAVAVMTVLLVLLFVVPLTWVVATLATHAPQIAEWVRSLASLQEAPLPLWVANLPFIGASIAEVWQHVQDSSLGSSVGQLAPFASRLATWVLGQIGSLGSALVQFFLTVILAAVLYVRGEDAAQALRQFGQRLGGETGEAAVVLCGQAIRGVALGVGLTAVMQTVLGGLGLWMASVPYVAIFTALMFVACIAQIGPAVVLLPATGWLFWNGQTGWGIFLALLSVGVMLLDNVVRPLLIRRGADLPLLLIFVGVIGGLVSLGLVGIFVGPVILAVTYTLWLAWLGGPLDGSPRSDHSDRSGRSGPSTGA